MAIGGEGRGLDPARARRDVAAGLERAFDACAAAWLELGRDLGRTPSAGLAHTPACVANASDLGQMMAWSRLVEEWTEDSGTTLVLCDDPWLFRHLAALPGVRADSPPPPLWRVEVRLALRGWVARTYRALALARAALALRKHRDGGKGGATLLVYGHPASTADGHDAYFGDLPSQLSGLGRVLHVDCPVERARELGHSLHAHGHPLFALLTLPFARWRPSRRDLAGRHGWLVRRAAAREGGTAQAALIRWQIHCQARWLAARRPRVVAWPWENHAWERALVREARRRGVTTIGYQHSVIGRQMLNYAPGSNPDGVASLPDRIPCSGEATRDQLAAWGVPEDRLAIGGALRFPAAARVSHDREAPVFMALPFDGLVATEMVEAARDVVARGGRRFLVKDHPMSPHAFDDGPGVTRTRDPLGAHGALSAVVFAATTVGLEALLAGLPTVRFRPRGRVSIDILPAEAAAAVTVADAEGLGAALDTLDTLAAPPPLARDRVFAPVDLDLWRHLLGEI
ncbi:MAG: hypothetical protein H7840_05395 [Alphaproteobacteria bacterium]